MSKPLSARVPRLPEPESGPLSRAEFDAIRRMEEAQSRHVIEKLRREYREQWERERKSNA